MSRLTLRQVNALHFLAQGNGELVGKSTIPSGLGVVTLDWLVVFGLAEKGQLYGEAAWRITPLGAERLAQPPAPLAKRSPGRPKRES